MNVIPEWLQFWKTVRYGYCGGTGVGGGGSGVFVGRRVAVRVGVGVGVFVGMGVIVGVAVGVGVSVFVGVAVGVSVGVSVMVGVGVHVAGSANPLAAVGCARGGANASSDGGLNGLIAIWGLIKTSNIPMHVRMISTTTITVPI
jgi:hypothetical protein